jgi:5-(carboxyamino)imidazole ribonucleotide synthase
MQKYDIGIIGGGQLGKMLIEEGLRYNVSFATLDPDAESAAANISSHHIVGSLQDAKAINALAACSKILTYEIEFINADALTALELAGHIVLPSSSILKTIQDKGLQKIFFTEHNIPTAPYVLVNNTTEWLQALQDNNFTKFAAKLRTGGYDGKGVALINTNAIANNEIEIPFEAPCVLEQFIEAEKEISIIVARHFDGSNQCFDAVEMEFDPVANLVTYLICPAKIDEAMHNNAKAIAINCIEKLNGVGIFAIEMFVTKLGDILVNEIAPRPHNSGHQSIEGCYTSQYEQLLRILLNKPLGDASIVQPSAMINILGPENFSGTYKLKGESDILKIPGVYIHMYRKAISKPNRKLGHITIIGKTADEVKTKADYVLAQFGVEKTD